MSHGNHPSLEALLSRAMQASAFEVPPATLDNALQLSRLLPRPTPGGLRAWFDRTIASLARPTFDEPAHALQGVRRLSGPRARGWQGVHVSVELEIADVAGRAVSQAAAQAAGEHAAGADAAGAQATIAVRGLITLESGKAPGPCAIAALLHDGRLALLAASDAQGNFALELPTVVHALAIATPVETILLEDVLAEPGDHSAEASPRG